MELLKEGDRSPTVLRELRNLEDRQAGLDADLAAAGIPEAAPSLHPNLPELYRRKVEMLEEALRDPATMAAAAEALRTLIDAILVFPGEKRGKVNIELRGDLAAFLRLGEAAASGGAGAALAGGQKLDSGTAIPLVGNGRSGSSMGVLGSLVAGIGFEPMTFRL